MAGSLSGAGAGAGAGGGGWRRGSEIERVDIWTSIHITDGVCMVHLRQMAVVVALQGEHFGERLGLGEGAELVE